MINYDDVISQLQAAGLIVDDGLNIDGRIRRTKTTEDHERRGWYCLHEWQSSAGNRYIVGSFGVWHGNDNGAQKIEFSKQYNITREEQAAIRQRIKEDKKRAEATQKQKQKLAARRAAAVWKKALTVPATGKSDYLERKGVNSYGLRHTESGALVVPMMDMQRNVHGLQFILPADHSRRKKTGRDKEFWPQGLALHGHFFMIGSPAAGVCLVAEGYATGATINAATGLPVAVAFTANNLKPVCLAIKKAYPKTQVLICADDDYLQKCKACGTKTDVSIDTCIHCGEPHHQKNPGVSSASIAALEVGAEWIKPVFPFDRDGQKLTDFNDLQQHEAGGLHLVSQQIENKLDELGWRASVLRGARSQEGGGDFGAMPARLSVDEAAARYWGTYGLGGKVLFDEYERRLIHKDDVVNLLPRHGWDDLKNHPSWRVARDVEVGFDPTEKDQSIICNLFGGWEMRPAPGKCSALLELLEYMCNNEQNGSMVYQWVLCWLAYPLQNPGAKMHSAIVLHGPQGTGKSRFFEAIVSIYGKYGRKLGQEALEDKFNSDWAQAKLFILADEVLARADMYHIKNRLKSFITGDTIRVNPKGIAAHEEKNQMNIVFLSNEHMPTVLENDDRRHCVIWCPPKLPDDFFHEVSEEIDNGGVEALYDHLMNLDLTDFKPWTKPPMTSAKQDLINLGISSNERFIKDWLRLEVEDSNGLPFPVCPCLGSHLYKLYVRWCGLNGESRPRPNNHFIGHLAKLPGWRAGKSERTYKDLKPGTVNGASYKNRKMVVPSVEAMTEALRYCSGDSRQSELTQRSDENKAHWLTRGFLAFEDAMGWNE